MSKKVFSKLPDVFKTETQRRFFDATIEQVFSKKQIEKIDGYIGRRVSGSYNPFDDYYKPEYNKERTRYQLEPVTSISTEDGEMHTFYYDYINYLKNNFENFNENASFSSKYTSFAPPINLDMFINYQNYYWMDELPDPIQLEGLDDTDVGNILGNEQYTAVQYQFVFENGSIVSFPDSESYNKPYFIEGVGTAIKLITTDSAVLAGNPNGNGKPDYFTLARGSTDGNLWSRYNRWVHVTAIESNNIINGTPFQEKASRAKMPILQFDPEITMYGMGGNFAGVHTFLVDDISAITQTSASLKSLFNIPDIGGDNGIYVGDTIISRIDKTIHRINSNTGNLDLSLVDTLDEGDNVQALKSYSDSDGLCYYVNGGQLVLTLQQKSKSNMPPLFEMYDLDGISLGDPDKYPLSSFKGNEIFMYNTDAHEGLGMDSDLDIRVNYRGLPQVSEILFDNKLLTDRYSYINSDNTPEIIDGYYYYYHAGDTQQGGNSWNESKEVSKQLAISKFVSMDSNDTAHQLIVTPINGKDSISVTVEGQENVEFDYVLHNGEHWINVTGIPLGYNYDIEVKVETHDRVENTEAYLETPIQSGNNPLLEEVYSLTLGQLTPHFVSIMRNNIDGREPLNRYSGYKDSKMDHSLGEFIIKSQYSSPLAHALTSEEIDLVRAINISKNDYENFKSKLITFALKVDMNEVPDDTLIVNYVLSELIGNVNASVKYLDAYSNSRMFPCGTPTEEQLLGVTNYEYGMVVPNTGVIDTGVDLEWFTVTVKDNDTATLLGHKVDGTKIYMDNPNANPMLNITLNALHIDTTDIRNPLSVPDTNHTIYRMDQYDPLSQELLIYGDHYRVVHLGGDEVVILSNMITLADILMLAIYTNDTEGCYIPATPTKIGMGAAHKPRIELDTTYVTPRYVIVGHDGSRVPVYGDYDSTAVDMINMYDNVIPRLYREYDIRDVILLQYEKIVYNQIAIRGGSAHFDDSMSFICTPLSNGYYNYYDLMAAIAEEAYLWSAVNEMQYEGNNTYDPTEWKTWNYKGTSGPNKDGTTTELAGNWRGIYTQYYRTDRPNIAPWEMLGFTDEPNWWGNSEDLGDGFTGYGLDYSYNNAQMWVDIEHGIIRRGIHAGISKYHYHGICGDANITALEPIDVNGNLMYVWNGTVPPSNIIPVDIGNTIRPVGDIFTDLSNGHDEKWDINDMSPVMYAWTTTSSYRFSLAMAYYIMRPYEFVTRLMDTENVELQNSQIIDKRTSHSVDYSTFKYHSKFHYVRGWSQWIYDMLSKSSKSSEGYLDSILNSMRVTLGNKVGGYTNDKNLRIYLDNVTVGGDSGSLLIPRENYQVSLHTGEPFKIIKLSGVLVRIVDGGYQVYGYDIKDPTFEYNPKSELSPYSVITRGGVPYSYTYYDYDTKYNVGDIVDKGGRYYRASERVTTGTFISGEWTLLPQLPMQGGITTKIYRDRAERRVVVPYGHIFTTVDQLIDFITGYGYALENDGWVFDSLGDDGHIDNWDKSIQTLLFWLANKWELGNALALCPSAEGVTCEYAHGNPAPILSNRNGAFNITDKYGFPISYRDVKINRDIGNRRISIRPNNDGDGIFFMRLHFVETEHIILIDNTTTFNDIIFSPLLGARQPRLRVVMRRTTEWDGSHAAPGYIISDNQLMVNFDTMSESHREMHSSGNLEDTDMQDAVNHTIGFERRDYLEELGVSDESQYNFYQGFLKSKGTPSSIGTLLKSVHLNNTGDIGVNEEWALKRADFGVTSGINKISFHSVPLEVSKNPQAYTLDSSGLTGYTVTDILFINREAVYSGTPMIIDDNLIDIDDKAIFEVILDNRRMISEVKVIYGGTGYPENASFRIDDTLKIAGNSDVLYPNLKREYTKKVMGDSIYINANDTDRWIYSNKRHGVIKSVPMITEPINKVPYAGYVHMGDIDHMAYDLILDLLDERVEEIREDNLIWIGNDTYSDWNVVKVISPNYTIGYDSVEITFSESLNYSKLKMRYGPYRLGKNTTGDYYVDSGPVVVVINGKNTKLTAKYIDEISEYILYDEDNEVLDNERLSLVTALYIFESRRYNSLSDIGSEVDNERVWVDNYDGEWATGIYDSGLQVDRQFMPMIATEYFDRLRINEQDITLVDMQVFDPFKDILLSEVEKAIDIKAYSDPALYGERNAHTTLTSEDVGKVWLDLSSVKYIMYEQPISINESIGDNINYRRKNWGKVFNGSPVNVYQWISSRVEPSKYRGSGKVFDTTKYVKEKVWSATTRTSSDMYYFWVTDMDDSVIDGKLSTNVISSLIRSPKLNGSSWYAPIYTDGEVLTIAIANENYNLVNGKGVVDVTYNNGNSLGHSHDQWQLVRNKDRFASIPDYYWEKLSTSLAGITRPIPKIEYPRGIDIGGDKVVLVVPDPLLSNNERYGIGIRPQQSIISDKLSARRVFRQKMNEVLKQVKIWSAPYLNWDSDISDSSIYGYSTWYLEGYEGVQPRITLDDINAASIYPDGTIFKVQEPNPQPNDRFEIYIKKDGEYILLAREGGRLHLTERFENVSDILSVNLSIIEFIDAMRKNVLVRSDILSMHDVFFSMLSYSISERVYNDWAFKTSYISIIQDGLILDQRTIYSPSNINSFISFMNETKPYHTKIREVIATYTHTEDASGTILDEHHFKVKVKFNRHMSTKSVIYGKQVSDRWNTEGSGYNEGKYSDSSPDYTTTSIIPDDNNETIYSSSGGNSGELARVDVNESVIIDVVDDNVVIMRDGLWDGQWGWDAEYSNEYVVWDSETDVDVSNDMEFKYRYFLSSYTNIYGEHHHIPTTMGNIITLEDISAGGISDIKISSDDGLEASGENIVWINQELFRYKRIVKKNGDIYLQSVTRMARGTTMREHPSGSNVIRADIILTDHESNLGVNGNYGHEYDASAMVGIGQEQTRIIEICEFDNGIPVNDQVGNPNKIQTKTTLINPWYTRLDMESPYFSALGKTGERKAIYSKASLRMLRWYQS